MRRAQPANFYSRKVNRAGLCPHGYTIRMSAPFRCWNLCAWIMFARSGAQFSEKSTFGCIAGRQSAHPCIQGAPAAPYAASVPQKKLLMCAVKRLFALTDHIGDAAGRAVSIDLRGRNRRAAFGANAPRGQVYRAGFLIPEERKQGKGVHA